MERLNRRMSKIHDKNANAASAEAGEAANEEGTVASVAASATAQ